MNKPPNELFCCGVETDFVFDPAHHLSSSSNFARKLSSTCSDPLTLQMGVFIP